MHIKTQIHIHVYLLDIMPTSENGVLTNMAISEGAYNCVVVN